MCGAVIKEGAAGRKSDVWSLGCTVIEMATGKAPWNEFTNPITAMVTIGNGPLVGSIAGLQPCQRGSSQCCTAQEVLPPSPQHYHPLAKTSCDAVSL